MNLTPVKNKDTKVTQKQSMNAEFNGTKPVAINPNETEEQMSKRRGKKKCKHKKHLANMVRTQARVSRRKVRLVLATN